ncbi:hypothetical protein F5Y16DRAFT_360452 [Xylariaceae sp. FL0255]|nr:hypothetical protein F5Y16DRAFT_360452 [Xylariaceae sp. FL0255]
MTGGISIRQWIRWLPDAESEPTSTMVLTSPERRFVDIRILNHDLMQARNPKSLSNLDWAFAGISSSTTQPNGTTHCKWQHVVDSRTRYNPESIVVDEGVIHAPRPDGKSLETGSMINPATGIMTDYEELWADEELGGVEEEGGDVYGGKLNLSKCVVLELDDPEQEARGLVIYLGKYCQGVMRRGSLFAAERWYCKAFVGDGPLWDVYRFEGDGSEGEVDGGVADLLQIPCEQAWKASKGGLEIGKTLELGGCTWRVVET